MKKIYENRSKDSTKPKGRRPPSFQFFCDMLQESGVRLSREQFHTLWTYHNLIRDNNQERELTRIVGFENMVIKHYIDCLIIDRFVRFEAPLLDIGSGAGFPGIPIKIQNPEIEVILAEPRPRLISFLEMTCQSLHLKGISIFPHKVTSRSFHRNVRTVITRALEDMEKTLKRIERFLLPGGSVCFMKGPSADKEVETLRRSLLIQAGAFRITDQISYHLPLGNHERRLIIVGKLR
jgi:16S rRNA (guanine527-N7)-methyltransferase